MDLVRRKRLWFGISAFLVVLSVVGLPVRQLNLSLEFEGGARLQYPNPAGVSVEEVRSTTADFGLSDAEVQVVGDGEISVRTRSLNDLGARRDQLLTALADQAGISPDAINVNDVGPTFGSQIASKALRALIVFLILVTIYISFRFEWKMALAAQAALLHDLAITAGIYALVGREVTPATVIAILTILGYSLYDTVVIFDKVKENTESLAAVARETYSGVVNTSLNQVFMRSVNTSLVVLLPILALLLFGGETLKDFAFALFVGVASGTYSSIFVAAPILAVLKEREPRLRQMRARAAARPTRPALRSVATAGTRSEPGEPRELQPAAASAPAATPVRSRPAQSRPKRKKPAQKRRRR
jgi:preprotein translocase subunit SecF